MAQNRPGSKRSEAAFDPDAEVVIEDLDLNTVKPKPRSLKKNSSVVMLDLSQSRLALYFLAAQASILVILLALILYFSSVLSSIRTLAQSVSDNLQMCKNVLEMTQQTYQQLTHQRMGLSRYKAPPAAPAVNNSNEQVQPPSATEPEPPIPEPPKRRRPKPS